eukprot:PhM_4_TR2256/c0_g1_i1/m.78342
MLGSSKFQRVNCTSCRIHRRTTAEVVPRSVSVTSTEGAISQRYVLIGAHKTSLPPLRSTETVNLSMNCRATERKHSSSSNSLTTPSSALTSVVSRTSLTVAQVELGTSATVDFSETPLSHDLNGAPPLLPISSRSSGSSSASSSHHPDDTALAEVVLGFRSGEVVVWDTGGIRMRLNTPKLNRVDDTAATCVTYLRGAPTEHSNRLLTGHASGMCYVYDLRLYPEKEKQMECNTFGLPEAHSLGVRTPGARVNVNPVCCFRLFADAVTCCASCPRYPTTIAIASRDSQLHVYSVDDGVISFTQRCAFGAFLCVAWSAESSCIAAGSEDDTFYVYSMRGQCIARLVGHRSWPMSVSFRPADSSGQLRVLTSGHDGLVAVWYLSADDLTGMSAVVVEPTSMWSTLHVDACVCARDLPGAIATACTQGYIRLWAEAE